MREAGPGQRLHEADVPVGPRGQGQGPGGRHQELQLASRGPQVHPLEERANRCQVLLHLEHDP